MRARKNIFFSTLVFSLVIVCLLSINPINVDAVSISIESTQSLDFGSFVPGSTSGTLTVNTDGNIDSSSGLGYVQGNTQEARFTVTGDSNTSYTITLPTDGTVELTDGGDPMPVNNFTSSPSDSGTGTLDGGNQTLYVGATLEVGGGQSAGSYTESFSVTVGYQ